MPAAKRFKFLDVKAFIVVLLGLAGSTRGECAHLRVMAGVLRILSRKHENKLREKGMGKLARGCASNQEMSSTKSGNESTHARKALKEFSGFNTRL
jgi:hypothetical protein